VLTVACEPRRPTLIVYVSVHARSSLCHSVSETRASSSACRSVCRRSTIPSSTIIPYVN